MQMEDGRVSAQGCDWARPESTACGLLGCNQISFHWEQDAPFCACQDLTLRACVLPAPGSFPPTSLPSWMNGVALVQLPENFVQF